MNKQIKAVYSIKYQRFIRNNTLYLIMVAFSIFTVSSCGGGGGENSQGNTKISDNTKVVSSSTASYLASASEDGSTFTFSQNTPELSDLVSGDIIVSDVNDKAPAGILRKVSSVSYNGDEVVVQTEQARLEEVIQEGLIDFDQQLIPASISALSVISGVSVSTETIHDGITFETALENVVLYDADEDLSTTDDQIIANGNIRFTDAYKLKILIQGSQTKMVKFDNSVDESTDLQLTVGVSASGIMGEKVIAQYTFEPTTVKVGQVPVVLTPIVNLKVGFNGEITVDATTDVSQETSYSADLDYQDGTWTTDKSNSNSFTFSHPDLNSECKITAYAGPSLSLLLYGVEAVYGEYKGTLEIDSTLTDSLWWGLYGGLEVNLGVYKELFSSLPSDHQETIINYNELLYETTFINTPPSAEITNPVSGNYLYGNTISFSGSGSDVEDGSLSGASLVWTSDIDGQIGTGTSFSTASLSVGTHSITLTATDSNGATSAVSRAITVYDMYTYSVGTYPVDLAIDSSGNVWVVNCYSDNVTKLSPAGTVLGTYAVGHCPYGIAIDTSGNVWVTNNFNDNITKLSSAGAVLGTYNYAANCTPVKIAVDHSGNVWVANLITDNVTKLSSTGALIGIYSVGSGIAPWGIAIDHSGNVWVSSESSDNVIKLSSTGSILGSYSVGTEQTGIALDGSDNVWVMCPWGRNVAELSSAGEELGSYIIGASQQPGGIAVDGSGNLWVTYSDKVTELSPTGSVLGTYTLGITTHTIAIDGSGNVWVVCDDDSVIELTGIASPVTTPLVLQ